MKDLKISAQDGQAIISNATCTVAKFSKHYTSSFGFERFFSKQDIEDITSKAICKACCSFSSFDPKKGTLSTWVTTIAKNCVIDAVDDKIKRIPISYSLTLENGVNGDEFERDEVCYPQSGFNSDITELHRDWDADAACERKEFAEALEMAISSLSERGQRVERMSLAGYAPREIAAMEGCTPKAISVLLNKNHKEMRDRLADFAEEMGLGKSSKGRKGTDE